MAKDVEIVANYELAVSRLVEDNGAIACGLMFHGPQVQRCSRQRVPDQLAGRIVTNGRNKVDAARQTMNRLGYVSSYASGTDLSLRLVRGPVQLQGKENMEAIMKPI